MKNNNKGFTLVELIAGLAVMGILMGFLFSLFLAGSNSFRALDKGSKAENEARTAMSFITAQIRQNDAVTTTGGGIYVQNVRVVPAGSDGIREHLQISDASGVRHIYRYPVTGTSAVCQLRESDSDSWQTDNDASIIADGLNNVTFTTFGAINGNTGIDIVIEYKDGNAGVKKLEESITLKAEED